MIWAMVLTKRVFANPRNTDQQTMAATKKRNQNLVNNFMLTDNDLADLITHPLIGGREILQRLFFPLGNFEFGGHVLGCTLY